VLEAPSLGVRTLDVGRRQSNRECGTGVLHVDTSAQSVADGLRALLAMGPPERDNPYFRPESARRIATVLDSIELDAALISKQYEDPLAATDSMDDEVGRKWPVSV